MLTGAGGGEPSPTLDENASLPGRMEDDVVTDVHMSFKMVYFPTVQESD